MDKRRRQHTTRKLLKRRKSKDKQDKKTNAPQNQRKHNGKSQLPKNNQ